MPSIFHVPAGEPFLKVLAEALIKGDLPHLGGDPPSRLDLADIELLLPTRRAVRALQTAFLDVARGRAMILPRVRAVSDADEELGLISGLLQQSSGNSAALDIPPAISELERRLGLTKLVLAWAEARQDPAVHLQTVGAGARTPAQAALLAADLARFMDAIETEGADLSRLPDLVVRDHAEHWQQTLDFLEIVTRHWPRHLEERGLVSPTTRRNQLVLAEARRLREHPPSTPIIVAGVTGSVPATAELMRAVAALPLGAIVLPNLDTVIDDEAWQAIGRDHPEHPQSGLKRLLGELSVERSDIRSLSERGSTGQLMRQRLVAEAMRPAETTENWHVLSTELAADSVAAGLAGVSLIEAPTPQDEAEVVALILREAAEKPGQTAALVSPDRLLARRVAVRLEAWGIRVDDSAGRPFGKTVPGAFLDLTLTAVSSGFAPRQTMALLKHPLTRLGLQPGEVRRAARALELIVFRASYIGHGLNGLAAAYEQAGLTRASGERLSSAAARLVPEAWEAARDLIMRLQAACGALGEALEELVPSRLSHLAGLHMAAAEALASSPDEQSSPPLWDGEAGETASLIFAGLMDDSLPSPMVSGPDYADFYRSLIAGTNVRQRIPVHPRLSIWGPFESRLQRPDIVILGSLNEGTWPEAADPGPWLNRPMLAQLGMPAPEERIGFSAHDFTGLMCADRVYMTRALKQDGNPTVASRWLMRLQALLGGLDAAHLLQPEKPWLAWAGERNRINLPNRIEAPCPRPALAMRPRRLSVTAVERWIANPYAIFAQRILHLERLPGLGEEPGPDQRGAIVHEAMKRFTEAHPQSLPADIEHQLASIARTILDQQLAHPRIAAFWLPRFERFASWFAATEAGRRADMDLVRAEVTGKEILSAPGGPFELTARADRLDIGRAGVVITDYKTGTPPNNKSVLSGMSPQLPLEAAMVLAGAFDRLETRTIAGLRYIRAHGGVPPAEQTEVKCDDFAGLATEVRAGLERLIAKFDDESTPYRAMRRAGFDYRYDDYAHLARAAEWGPGEADEG